MLWRRSYAPTVLRDVPLPGLIDNPGAVAIVVVYRPEDFVILGNWRRLLADWNGPTIWAAADGPNGSVARALRGFLPRSAHASVHSEPLPQMWREISPEERIVAAVWREGRAECVVIGPPTEEAFEAFQRALDGVP